MLARSSQARGLVVQLREQEVGSLLHPRDNADVYPHERRGNPRQSEEAIKECTN